jgi:O-succinylbenzoic acid--CoA ligase
VLLERAADHGWPVLTTYGLTEACSQVTTQPYGTTQRGELGAGPPLPGTEIRIDDDEAILVRGPTLLSRYLITDHGGATRPVDPLSAGGWLSTGDYGRLDERGNLHVLGRRGDRIISGGENVDPVEVEQALEGVASVRQACVFGIPDEEWGEVVCAAVVPGDRTPTGHESAWEGSLLQQIAELRNVLAPFKVPRRVAILPVLPLNATGKVDRAETARQAASLLRPVRG